MIKTIIGGATPIDNGAPMPKLTEYVIMQTLKIIEKTFLRHRLTLYEGNAFSK
ncbi:MAG: hypothetical protein OJF59_001194 [Cytophagales bacterium]|nr:MAG: hypothetical protein OJF59_001194 [Cytophagales bacterium]